jgi:hypothetical protein
MSEKLFIRYEAIKLYLTFGGKYGLFEFLEGKTVSNWPSPSVDAAPVCES